MKLPEIHVYGKGPYVSRVVWKANDGTDREIDLTGCKVTVVNRRIDVGSIPIVGLKLIGRLVEHGEEAA